MKKFFAAAFFCASLATVATAGDFQTKAVVDLGGGYNSMGNGGFTARMYNKCPITGMDLVWGGTAAAAGKNLDTSFKLALGVVTEAPILGKVEIVSQSSMAAGSPVKLLETISLNKNYLYKLAENVEIGLTLELAELKLVKDGSYISFVDGIRPVLAAKIAL